MKSAVAVRPARGLAFSLMLTLLIGAAFVRAQPAEALCIAQPEEGLWANVDPNTGYTKSIELRAACRDHPAPPEPDWTVRVYPANSCYDPACPIPGPPIFRYFQGDGERINGGAIHARVPAWAYTLYTQARMAPDRPGQLYVFTWIDTPTGLDHAIAEYFRKVR